MPPLPFATRSGDSSESVHFECKRGRVAQARRAAPSNYSSEESARAVYEKRKKCKAAAEAHGETPVVLAARPEEKPQLPVAAMSLSNSGPMRAQNE